MAYQIFTDSSSDLSTELRKKHNISYFRMGFTINGKEEYHADIDYEEYSPEQLYKWIGNTKNVLKTSLVTMGEFFEKMEPFLEKGIDILYLACSGSLSGTINVFRLASEELQDKYPERKFIAIDTCRADMSLGLLVLDACKLRDEGKSIEEVAKWAEDNKQFYHEVGSLDTLTFLKNAGRVSGSAAFFGNMIGIKPLIMFNRKGENYAYKKVRGMKVALEESFNYIKDNMVPGVTDVVYVGQAMAPVYQEYMKNRIENELKIKVEPFWIGPIVGISCGPGMYGCFFKGKEVKI